MLKQKRKKVYPLNIRKFESSRKLHRLLKEKQKFKLPRAAKIEIKRLQNKMLRNVALKMRLREHFGWGKSTFRRSLDRMKGRGYRIPRLVNLRIKM